MTTSKQAVEAAKDLLCQEYGGWCELTVDASAPIIQSAIDSTLADLVKSHAKAVAAKDARISELERKLAKRADAGKSRKEAT
jgi:hypothetical protein